MRNHEADYKSSSDQSNTLKESSTFDYVRSNRKNAQENSASVEELSANSSSKSLDRNLSEPNKESTPKPRALEKLPTFPGASGQLDKSSSEDPNREQDQKALLDFMSKLDSDSFTRFKDGLKKYLEQKGEMPHDEQIKLLKWIKNGEPKKDRRPALEDVMGWMKQETDK